VLGVSNISIGTANDQAYVGMPYINASANFDYSYNLSYFGFGAVQYNAQNASDTTQYYESLGTTYPVAFSTGFKGIGLPPNVFLYMQTLLNDISNDAITCDYSQDGIFQLPY